jgi:hypothetical protein
MMHAGVVPDPETVGKWMTLNREWEADEARKEYTRAIVALKRDLPTVIAKDAAVDFQGGKGRVLYRHASLANLVDSVAGVMASHGFSHSWHPSTAGRLVTVECRITHGGGHSEACSLSEEAGGGSAVNGIPGTITRLQRYTLLSILGLATGDMPERSDDEPADESQIDSARNLKAAAALAKYGRTRAQAEELLGRPVPDWTAADLDKLRDWLKPPATTKPPEVVDERTGEVVTTKPVPADAGQLADLLRVLAMASTSKEVDAVLPYLDGLGAEAKATANTAIKYKREAIWKLNKKPAPQRREPGQDG